MSCDTITFIVFEFIVLILLIMVFYLLNMKSLTSEHYYLKEERYSKNGHH